MQRLRQIEILENVWAGRIVTEDSLAKSVSELRKFLKDHLSGLMEIETIRNVGYQLSAPDGLIQQEMPFREEPETYFPIEVK